ncbi:MAG: hypothetical protein L3J35_03575 [Bacteroidales bacterium]|nr:hypothetical protein [Bacteroidales bacterium]
MTKETNNVFIINPKTNETIYIVPKIKGAFQYSLPSLHAAHGILVTQNADDIKILQLKAVDCQISILQKMRKAIINFYEKESQTELF